MKKAPLSFLVLLFLQVLHAQDISTRLQSAYTRFENDSQLSSALSSLYVIDAASGKVVFAKNEKTGLATASTLKVVTAATAYETLGKDFRYTTTFGYQGNMSGDTLHGSLRITPSGDPTLGSWRWPSTGDKAVLGRIIAAIKKTGIRQYDSVMVNEEGWEGTTIPDGWIWQDIGNYYGAGAQGLNWHENQYDLVLSSKIIKGSKVPIIETRPRLYFMEVTSLVTSAAKGTGDQTYIYLPIGGSNAEIRGTIPVGEPNFIVSGAMTSPRNQFVATLIDTLTAMGIRKSTPGLLPGDRGRMYWGTDTVFHREQSPTLDSIVYWFLKKSINLYGEALLKAMPYKQTYSSSGGVELVKDFWKTKGIEPTELNIVDGSGLSPLDRVTTHAQVTVLKYAKKQPWFGGYYNAFPEYNGMKMKSGTISGVKGFCGYQTARDGHEYIFSFLVNNYNGTASQLVQKMYAVLDELKK